MVLSGFSLGLKIVSSTAEDWVPLEWGPRSDPGSYPENRRLSLAPRPSCVHNQTYLDSEQQAKQNKQTHIYIYTYVFGFLCLICFLMVFGQSWAQERARRPRLGKLYINQHKLTREIDPKATRKLKYKIWP